MIQYGVAREILGSRFYTYHAKDSVWLGIMLLGGTWHEQFSKSDWIDWLRQEMELSEPTELEGTAWENKDEHI